MWNLKNDTNELIYKNRLTVIEKKNLCLPKGKGEERQIESLGLTYTY